MEVINTFDTSLYACGLEVLSHSLEGEESLRRRLLCTCYRLDEANGTREGCIQSYIIQDNQLIEESVFSCPAGVLDIKLDGTYVATALSNGQCIVYRASAPQGSIIFDELQSFSSVEEGLFLSIDYNHSLSGGDDNRIGATTQASSIILLSHGPSGLEIVEHKEQTHLLLGEPMPVWTVAMDKFHDRNRFISGGDDMVFRLWDLRCESSISQKKYHSAGVTTAQWHPTEEFYFLTGSYDDTCCIWDVRQLSRPICPINVGGGVWRAKWTFIHDTVSPDYPDAIVTTAMQSGCSIHRISHLSSGDEAAMSLKSKSFSNGLPSQLIYDIVQLDDPQASSHPVSHFACCSFYDKKLYHIAANYSSSD